jgi:hypothetical protein
MNSLTSAPAVFEASDLTPLGDLGRDLAESFAVERDGERLGICVISRTAAIARPEAINSVWAAGVLNDRVMLQDMERVVADLGSPYGLNLAAYLSSP